MKHFALIILAVALSGCIRIFPETGDAPKTLLLKPGAISLPEQKPVSWQLLVMEPSVNAHLDTNLIAVEHQASTAQYVEGSEWPDDLPNMVQELVLDAFLSSKKIMGVSTTVTAIDPLFGLQIDVNQFGLKVLSEKDAPKVLLDITARMIDFRTREVVDMKTFQSQRPASSKKVENVIVAFDAALIQLLTDLTKWTLSHQETVTL